MGFRIKGTVALGSSLFFVDGMYEKEILYIIGFAEEVWRII